VPNGRPVPQVSPPTGMGARDQPSGRHSNLRRAALCSLARLEVSRETRDCRLLTVPCLLMGEQACTAESELDLLRKTDYGNCQLPSDHHGGTAQRPCARSPFIFAVSSGSWRGHAMVTVPTNPRLKTDSTHHLGSGGRGARTGDTYRARGNDRSPGKTGGRPGHENSGGGRPCWLSRVSEQPKAAARTPGGLALGAAKPSSIGSPRLGQ
jgi:hypothetical protein